MEKDFSISEEDNFIDKKVKGTITESPLKNQPYEKLKELITVSLLPQKKTRTIVFEKMTIKNEAVQIPIEEFTKWKLYFNVGAVYHNSKLVPTSDPLFNKTYNDTHKEVLSWMGELGFNYSVNSSLGFSGGIVTHNLVSSIRHQYLIDENEKSDEYLQIIDTNGKKIASSEQKEFISRKHYKGTWYSNSTEVGVKAGFLFAQKLPYRLKLQLGIGAYTNMLSIHGKSFLNNDLIIEQISDGIQHTLDFNINPYAAFSIDYTLKNGLETGIQASFLTLKHRYNYKQINNQIYNIGLVCRYPIN